ncbi:UNVERIFIED_CONTAM: hypothetical protein Scaly_0085500 [Sesamum calycinum]|uniref:RNase H type-1 domain-containing protein n=1 Tax=Sesamum calycinum TaxID=2727403 RepID=A0AAW2SXU1_9LAMI
MYHACDLGSRYSCCATSVCGKFFRSGFSKLIPKTEDAVHAPTEEGIIQTDTEDVARRMGRHWWGRSISDEPEVHSISPDRGKVASPPRCIVTRKDPESSQKATSLGLSSYHGASGPPRWAIYGKAAGFSGYVIELWESDFVLLRTGCEYSAIGSGIVRLQQKLVRLKHYLKEWRQSWGQGGMCSIAAAAERQLKEADEAYDHDTCDCMLEEWNCCSAELVWHDGEYLTNSIAIKNSATFFFQQLLTAEPVFLKEMNSENLKDGLTDEDRRSLCVMPIIDEVREAVSSIDPDSVSGPDGQVLLLLPYLSFRRQPAQLPGVSTGRLAIFAPGRLLSDNVLLAQELIHSLESRWPEANVVFKLDMAKAYDRGLDRLFAAHPSMYYQAPDRIRGCAMMNLSHGGRLALIRSVSQATPLHLLQAHPLVFLGKGMFSSGKGWIGCSESARLCSGLCHEAVVAVSEQIPIAPGQGDNIVWKGSSERAFSIKSACEAIRMTSPRRQLLVDVRHRSLRLTISVFLWRLFQDRIPVDAKMKQKGLSFPSKSPSSHTVCCTDLGDLHRAGAIGFVFRQPVHRAPSIVSWSTPSPSWFKLHTDGSSLGNPGLARAVGISRYSDGHVHRAYQVTLGTEIIMIAEVTVVWRGLELALAHGLTPLVVEVNAMAVIQLLQLYASGKWEVQHLILHIVQIQQMLVSDFRHTFKEANVAIDHLVKEAASLQLTRVLGHGDITSVLRSNLNRDRRGVPHLRRGR